MNHNNQQPGSADLLPCPFCGGAVELERTTGSFEKIHGQREWWGVKCRNTINVGGTCAIEQVPSASKEAAVERWNRRAPSPQVAEELPHDFDTPLMRTHLHHIRHCSASDLPDAHSTFFSFLSGECAIAASRRAAVSPVRVSDCATLGEAIAAAGYVKASLPDVAMPEPVMWFEAEPSARGREAKDVIGSMLYSTRVHTKKPNTTNPVWPLYAAPLAAQPAEGSADTPLQKAKDALQNIRDTAYFDSHPHGAIYYGKAENALATIENRDAEPMPERASPAEGSAQVATDEQITDALDVHWLSGSILERIDYLIKRATPAAVVRAPADLTGQDIDAAEKQAALYDGDDRECIKTDVMNSFYAGITYERKRAAEGATPAGEWISVDERLPDNICLAVYQPHFRGHKPRVIRAVYFKQYQVRASGEDGEDTEYNDADDEEYIKPGWYERIDNWGDFSSVAVCEGEVTHWMPLPQAPRIDGDKHGEQGGEA